MNVCARPTSELNPQHIFDAVKASLQRLQLDYIDVVQCKQHYLMKQFRSDRRLGHRFDYATPVGETV